MNTEPRTTRPSPPAARALLAAMLIVPAIIHLLPLYGLMGPGPLASLYGIDATAPDLALLMRHRAVLFGLLGALLLAAAFRPGLRTAALLGGFGSVVSFLALAWLVDGENARLARVAAVDWLALACLGVAAVLHGRSRVSRG